MGRYGGNRRQLDWYNVIQPTCHADSGIEWIKSFSEQDCSSSYRLFILRKNTIAFVFQAMNRNAARLYSLFYIAKLVQFIVQVFNHQFYRRRLMRF